MSDRDILLSIQSELCRVNDNLEKLIDAWNSEHEEEPDKIKKLEAFLEQNGYADMQRFNTRNIVGDCMQTIYEEDGITVDYCHNWGYIEIFGLTQEEFDNLFQEEPTEEFTLEELKWIKNLIYGRVELQRDLPYSNVVNKLSSMIKERELN